MKALEAAQLVTSKKIKNWVFYKTDRAQLQQLAQTFAQAANREASATP